MSRGRKSGLGVAVWATGVSGLALGFFVQAKAVQMLLFMSAFACWFAGTLLVLDAIARPRSEPNLRRRDGCR